MDLHNLSDEQKRQIIDAYIRRLDQHNNDVQQSNSGAAILIFMSIIIGGIGSLFVKGDVGTLIAQIGFGFALVIFVFTKIAKLFSRFTDSDPFS